jgi:ParB family chromosome partitioning protein
MKRTKALGRGLDALIPLEEQPGGMAFLCPVDAITPHPGQPRQRFDPEKLQELVQTIREKGVLSPILVRSHGEGYQLISGERRWRAAKMAGLKEIPAILREVSDQEALELSLIENIQREDLSPLEEARAYQALMELHNTTQEELAKRLGKDRSTLANALRLLKLPKPAQEALDKGQITPGHARCILSVKNEQQETLLRAILARGLSVRAAEDMSRALARAPQKSRTKSQQLPPEVAWIRDRLRARLSTRVRIQHGRRKGAILIEYYGPQDLERILRLLGVSPNS